MTSRIQLAKMPQQLASKLIAVPRLRGMAPAKALPLKHDDVSLILHREK